MVNKQDALTEGAAALAYRAEKLGYELHNLVGDRYDEAQTLITFWRDSQAILLQLAQQA